MSISTDLVKLNSAVTQLMRTIRRVDDSQGVGPARLSALAVLHFGGPCSLTELARKEMVSRATMHHIIAGLESDGHISRKANKVDARRQRIELTKRGTGVIIEAHRARIEFYRSLLQGTSAQELAIAAEVLSRIRDCANSEVNE